jgi:predicted nucleic acid-binding protein
VTIVIDASVTLKWVLEEPRTEAALDLLEQPLIAPALWLAEAANALWRHVRLAEITAEQASARMSELESSPIASLAIQPYASQALQLAMRLSHPVYDCFYLAVAIRHDTYVVTDDRRFASAAVQLPDLAARVRLLGA